MLKLLLRTGLLVSSLLITLGLLYRHAVRYSHTSYLAAIVDKHHRADLLKNQPRLVVTGGSGTAFAVDSQLLEDSLHRPVVNLAMHAGLGLPFMLRQVQTVARPGDIVLLTPEYFLGHGDDYTQFYAGEFYAPALDFMTFSGPVDYVVRRANYWLKRIQISLFLGAEDQRQASITDTTSVYFRAGFSQRGDLISPLNNQRPAAITSIQIVSGEYTQELALIDTTAAVLHRRGATLLVAYPALAESQFRANREPITRFADKLRQLRAVALLGRPEAGIYPDSCFFDTPYHLHGLSRQAHTRELIRQIRESRPGQSRPGQSRPGQSRPGQSRPGQSRRGQSRPGQSRPGQSRPGQMLPTVTGSHPVASIH